jgi:thymidylate synthase
VDSLICVEVALKFSSCYWDTIKLNIDELHHSEKKKGNAMQKEIIDWQIKMQERNKIEELEDKIIQLNKAILEKQPIWSENELVNIKEENKELKKTIKLNENKIKHLEDLNNTSLIDVIKCKISKLFKYKLNITIEKR